MVDIDSFKNVKILRYTQFPADSTAELESIVNEIDSRLPPIKFFILPSGGHASAQVLFHGREFNVLLAVQ